MNKKIKNIAVNIYIYILRWGPNWMPPLNPSIPYIALWYTKAFRGWPTSPCMIYIISSSKIYRNHENYLLYKRTRRRKNNSRISRLHRNVVDTWASRHHGGIPETLSSITAIRYIERVYIFNPSSITAIWYIEGVYILHIKLTLFLRCSTKNSAIHPILKKKNSDLNISLYFFTLKKNSHTQYEKKLT